MKELRPFFSYYGSKYKLAPYYPEPRYTTIIEPFAGSACYSVRYYRRNVRLYDINPVVCGTWEFLIRSSAEDILRLPLEFEHTDELIAQGVCQEARWLIGWWLEAAQPDPAVRRNNGWVVSGVRPNCYWSTAIRARIAQQVDAIKHWRVFNKSFDEIDDERATWFVDPPYERGGKKYIFRDVDYAKLAEFCRNRSGQVIACGEDSCQWLPFHVLKDAWNGQKNPAVETLWTNDDNGSDVQLYQHAAQC